jgi:hypothetical protein
MHVRMYVCVRACIYVMYVRSACVYMRVMYAFVCIMYACNLALGCFTISSFTYLLHVSVVRPSSSRKLFMSEITLLTTDPLFLDIN